MNAVQIIQLAAGLAAIATVVALEAFGVELSELAQGLLVFVAGWVTKRPSDMKMLGGGK